MLTKKTGLVLLLVAVLSQTSCSKNKATVGLDVNVYVHPSSADLADILLQTAIERRLNEDSKTRQSLIHVRVEERTVVLTGAAKPEVSAEAYRLALETKLTVNDKETIVPKTVTNRIDTK